MSEARMNVSVVIPCLNAEDTLGDQLTALSRQEWPGACEVIVADNGSTDGTAQVVESFQGRIPGLRIADASDRRGSSHARNVGVRDAHGKWILFCDADDLVPDDWVKVMFEALQEHDLVACRMDAELLNERWQVESWPNGQESGLLGFSPRFLPFGAAGTLGMNRSVFESVGGFDTELRARVDNDFCWKAQLQGFSIHFVAETCIYYRYPTSFRHMYRQSRGLAEHQVILYKRYRPHGMPRLPLRKALRGRVRWSRLLYRSVRWPALDRVERASLVRDLGYKVGRLRGSIRTRTLAL